MERQSFWSKVYHWVDNFLDKFLKNNTMEK